MYVTILHTHNYKCSFGYIKLLPKNYQNNLPKIVCACLNNIQNFSNVTHCILMNGSIYKSLVLTEEINAINKNYIVLSACCIVL